MNYIIIFLLVDLIFIGGLVLTYPMDSSAQEDSLENIHLIGLEARQEMDHIYDDFVRRQVQHLLNRCTSTSHTNTNRRPSYDQEEI